jgi:hypothetical protein
MGKGIVRISYIVAAQWFADGKKVEDVKSIMRLPENYEVNNIEVLPENYEMIHVDSDRYNCIRIIVSSPDIPETTEGGIHPNVIPMYTRNDDGSLELKEIKIFPLDNYTAGENPEVLLADRMLKEMDLELDKKMKEGNW